MSKEGGRGEEKTDMSPSRVKAISGLEFLEKSLRKHGLL